MDVKGKRIHPGLATLAELGIMFLPAIPAYIWAWPALQGSVFQDIFQVAAYLYILLGTIYIGRRRWNWAQLGLNRKGIPLSLACGGVLLAGRLLAVFSAGLAHPEHVSLAGLAGEIIFYFLIVGLVEELLFRGLIYRALKEWKGPAWAIWGSTAGFALYHLPGQGPVIMLGAFIIGIIFAMIRWRAGGIVGLIFVHGLIDVVSLRMLPEEFEFTMGQVIIPHPGLAILSILVLLSIPLYLWLGHPVVKRLMARTARARRIR
jgi:membrane protease YdiL (CAAX protease family)